MRRPKLLVVVTSDQSVGWFWTPPPKQAYKVAVAREIWVGLAWLGFKGGSPNYVRTSSDFRLEQASLVSKSEEQRDRSRNFSVHISVGLFSDFFSQKKTGRPKGRR